MGRTQINLQVSPETKDEWEQYADNSPEASSLSHLIRLSVAEHIAGSDGQDQSDRTEQRPKASGEVLNALNRIENNISDLGDRMDVLERESNVEQTYDLQKAVYAVLPNKTNSDDPDGIGSSEIATRLGAEPGDVRDALTLLDTSYTSVSKTRLETEEGPRVRYYKLSEGGIR